MSLLRLWPLLKYFIRWVFDGNDRTHVKRAIIFGIALSALTACGIMGFYIRHLWNLPRGANNQAAASPASATASGGKHAARKADVPKKKSRRGSPTPAPERGDHGGDGQP